ncbi:MAG TPA: endonuclease/exonuclease/phosphatase family protein [Methylomirabilota bacterium]|nr:endonuclease/exonuclease/phosphatase family protein [Methylomirabilota bacterium]
MMSIKKGKVLSVFCRVAVGLFSSALICGTAVPILHSNAWWIRVFDFPRLQIAALMGLALAGYAVLHLCGRLRPWEYALAALVGLGLVWQLVSIAPYTAFYPREMADSRAEDDSNRISLLAYNVLSGNREVEALRDLIRDTDPDLILLSEPTRRWLEQLDGLEESYPYTLHQPQENQYGMLLYSRLELVNPEIRFLIEPGIPSFRSQVRLRSGTLVTLYGLHPRPPGLKRPDEGEDGGVEEDDGERVDSVMRDAELLLVATEIQELGDVPVIVAGDLNDVAWSHTTRLFQRIGGLLDPRVGRGLFNTFDASSRFLRFPLDHVFASEHFLLVELRRLPDIGSDHFPLLVVLDYGHGASAVNEEPQPDAGDEEEAAEAIDKGKSYP